jgi:hypothetical protein
MTRVLQVEAGPNTVQVRLRGPGAGESVDLFRGQLSAMFSAFGEAGS